MAEDRSGKKLKHGDRVYFPARIASSCYLRTGLVETIPEQGYSNILWIGIRCDEKGTLCHRLSRDVVLVDKKS